MTRSHVEPDKRTYDKSRNLYWAKVRSQPTDTSSVHAYTVYHVGVRFQWLEYGMQYFTGASRLNSSRGT